MRALSCWLATSLLVAACSASPGTSETECSPDEGCQPNVLLIIVDDLRPELGAYGRTHAVSPNIDRLAAEGVLFESAYVQVPVCGASRASFLSGLRPNRTRFTNFASRIDTDAPDAISLPELFEQEGYVTIANGKVHHDADDGVARWSEAPWRPGAQIRGHVNYVLPENIRMLEEDGRGPAYESADVDDFAYTDGEIVARSIEQLETLAAGEAPFFLAVGLYRPHLPFNAPTRYWDLYELAAIPAPEPGGAPENAPEVALHDSLELQQYAGIPPVGTPIDAELARMLRHGYLASVSYSDALVGHLLDAVDELDLRDDTIVVLVGDNGFSLGEHAMWVKHSNFDDALRVPLIMRIPGARKGARVTTIVELLDMYPTLADLAGLAPPAGLDGQSLRDALAGNADPQGGHAVSQYHSTISRDPGPWLGESIRTDNWLFTEWREDDGELHARMLYDHASDEAETENIAESAEPSTVESLSGELRMVTGTPGD